MKFTIHLIISLMLAFIISCQSPYTPKPRGYFRIELPEKSYQRFDTTYPYSFEYPVYATISESKYAQGEKYWIDIKFEAFDATIHISYKDVNGNLITYLEDAYTLATKHIPKADAIYDSVIIHRNRDLFGLIYQIEGSEVASPYQFLLTDSTSHFVRGALYFNTIPNNDSLQPVINLLKDDIDHMINTFQWN
ncbi:MAG: gliding motility lipoprotein GldD [Marinilabiliales bacterium]|jgi:gliding motility-associated lipoprotein GldD|nr:MAG: gliding motility lipoprotein GldD [Marinilabiliales bacterium]